MLEESEKIGKYPTGVLKQDENVLEYCEAYEKVKEARTKFESDINWAKNNIT